MDDAAVVALVVGDSFRRATFAGRPRGTPTPWVRVTVRPVDIKGERLLQFSHFDGTKTLTRNLSPGEAGAAVGELLACRFAGVHVSTATEEIDLRTSKKGKTTVGVGPAVPDSASDSESGTAGPTAHNRTKNVPLPEGRPDRLLEVMGVATAAGRVKPTMRGKFTQINEFLKHLAHGLHAADLTAAGRPLDILDCGCGASYLTLAAHHYLNHVRGVPARLVGVDVNDDLVRKSASKSDALGLGGLTFACGRIGTVDVPADVVVALHACDTATDDALIQAVRSGAKLILCAPCCHRHLNRQMATNGALLRHGILRERQADLLTDALRAAALRAVGYRAEVVEFVGLEHTARNLLIRAVKVGAPGDPAAVAEYQALKAAWGVEPYIDRLPGLP